MPLVDTREMFKKAYEGHYAIGAFNINNMEQIQGIVDACNELHSPVILQVSRGARKYAKPIYLKKMVEAAVEDSNIPIALHLDHGDTFETCKDCIDGGFTSVMIDGSSLSLEENIALTKKVCEYAHKHVPYVTVEGELGRLAGVEEHVNVSAEDILPVSLSVVICIVDVSVYGRSVCGFQSGTGADNPCGKRGRDAGSSLCTGSIQSRKCYWSLCGRISH